MNTLPLLARGVLAANVLVAGAVGVPSLLAPARAARTIWEGTTPANGAALRVVGAFWTAIALVSLFAVLRPATAERLAPVLLVQLLYKGAWLAAVAGPALARGDWRAARHRRLLCGVGRGAAPCHPLAGLVERRPVTRPRLPSRRLHGILSLDRSPLNYSREHADLATPERRRTMLRHVITGSPQPRDDGEAPQPNAVTRGEGLS